MKTLILKGLLVLGFVLGLSAIACAQDDEKPAFTLRTEQVKMNPEVVKQLAAIKAESQAKKGNTVRVNKQALPAKKYPIYQEVQLKREVE